MLPCERLSGKPDAISKQSGQSLIVGVTVTDVMLTVFFPMGALYLAVVNIPTYETDFEVSPTYITLRLSVSPEVACNER